MGKLIGSHNSATGEKPVGWLSRLLLPTAKCQTKTIVEQYNYGVRLFDLRITSHKASYNKSDVGYEYNLLGHGISYYDITLDEALSDIRKAAKAKRSNKTVCLIITYEGRLNEEDQQNFVADILDYIESMYYNKFCVLQIAVKRPKWKLLYDNKNAGVTYSTDYFRYDKWYKYLLPFPKLWKRWQKYSDTGRRTFSLRDFV